MVAEAQGLPAFVFPGQASQQAGMAAGLLVEEASARELFQRAGEILGLDLAEVCTAGDDALLRRTDIAQPALLATCVAWERALRKRGVEPRLVAGHSLGEYSAWVSAGALEFEEAIRLVRRRGELMEEASRRRPGGMVAVIGLPDKQVEEICAKAKRFGVVVAANYNSPGQVVVSGEEAALEAVKEAVKAAKARAIPLRVSGAFHSPLMEDAAQAFSALVSKLTIREAKVPVVVNATAEPVVAAEEAREAMSVQMTSPVRWTASVKNMVQQGVSTFVEVGPGKVLSNLVERISSDVRCLPVGTPGGLKRLVEEVEA
jgi:[acyl-carrier-protein] S-malonyltransferase